MHDPHPGVINVTQYTKTYIKTLRKTLDAHGHRDVSIVGSDRGWEPIASDFLSDPEVRAAIGALTQHYPHCDAVPGVPGAGEGSQCGRSIHNALKAHNMYGVEVWSSEDYSCWTDANGAGVWASEINSQYIGGNVSMISAWHLVSAFYPTVSFWNEGMISATQPWSGNYVLSPTIWASAHTTQFTRPGMHYLLQGRGAGPLHGGGTYVTFHDSEHLTIVIETASAAVGSFCDANCNGRCQLAPATGMQQAIFELQNLKIKMPKQLGLWRTKLGGNISEATSFQALAPVIVSSTGRPTTSCTILCIDCCGLS